MVHMTSVEEDGAVRVERGWREDSELQFILGTAGASEQNGAGQGV